MEQLFKTPKAKPFKLTLKDDGDYVTMKLDKPNVNLSSGNFKYDIKPRR